MTGALFEKLSHLHEAEPKTSIINPGAAPRLDY